MVSEQQAYENAYVPAQGIYIWKYKKDSHWSGFFPLPEPLLFWA